MFNATPEDLKQVHAALEAGLENRTLNPVIGKELPLADVITAHAAVMEPGAYGKIVMIP
jgi:NADPH2:quinone reductase